MYTRSQLHVIGLYLMLRSKGVPCLIEHFDGYMTIDIAILEAKFYIEVDGSHHVSNPDVAFCLRSVFSPAILLPVVPCKKHMTTTFAHLRKFEKEILGME